MPKFTRSKRAVALAAEKLLQEAVKCKRGQTAASDYLHKTLATSGDKV